MNSAKAKVRRSCHSSPCSVCGKTGCGKSQFQKKGCLKCNNVGCEYCKIDIAMCWRVQSDRQSKSGSWLHFSDNYEARTFPVQRVYEPPPIAPIERRHAAYSALLDKLFLSAAHTRQLTERRHLTEETITIQGFASVPDRALAALTAGELSKDHDLNLVPGFFLKGERWRIRFAGMAAMFIPIRDAKGRIAALQVRRDEERCENKYMMFSSYGDDFPQGASSGAPPHFAKPHRCVDGVVITEGALKANIAADILDVCVVGLVAVGTFSDRIGWELRNALPSLRRVLIAYDADWKTNDKVERQMKRLKGVLEHAGIHHAVWEWPMEQGKGLDDYLIRKR